MSTVRRRQRRRRQRHRLRVEDRLGLVGGGIIGALLRVAVTDTLPSGDPHGIPWGTLTVNTAGTFVLAFLLMRWSRPGRTPTRTTLSLHRDIARGMLGAFTTFSAFAVEVVTKAEAAPTVAAGYGLGSVALGLGAAWAGARLVDGRSATKAHA
jgi:CrcB protein